MQSGDPFKLHSRQMAPRLNQLPSELIDTIASFLSEEDLLTTRFVCHRLRSESESVFRRTFFTSRTTSLDMDDLHTLLEISKHPRFSGDINTLNIDVRLLARSTSSQCPLDLCEPFIFGAEEKEIFRDPHRQRLQEYRNALRKLSEAQGSAERVGLQTAVLTSILRNLSALTSIHVGRDCKSRFRKKVEKDWHSVSMGYLVHYGFLQAALDEMFEDGFGVDKVLTAMSVSMNPFTSLAIKPFGLGSSSSAIPEHLPTALSYSLNTVRVLKLWLTPPRVHTQQYEIARLLSYITAIPNVEHLELECSDSAGLAIEQIGARILWPNLTHLKLRRFSCTAEGLHNFIRKHANTLREITFYHGLLHLGDWRPILFSILSAGKAQVLELFVCLPFSNHDRELFIEFAEAGTPAEVSATLSKFLKKLPQS